MSFDHINGGWQRPQPNSIEHAALDWLARYDRGMTGAEESEFERWLAADWRHAQVFSEFDGTWSVLNRVRETPEGVAAVASGEIDADVFSPARTTAAPAGLPAPAAHGRRNVVPFSRPRLLPLFAVAAALVVVAIGSWRLARITQGISLNYAGSATTELGGMRKLSLPDGSVVHLNTDSAVEVQFTSVERKVQLTRGEAHFTVARNQTRPFVVSAAGVDVRAVGTAFNVRLRSEGVEVLVTEGKVRVNKDTASFTSRPQTAASSPTSSSLDGAVEVRPAGIATVEIASLSAGEKIVVSPAPPVVEVALPVTPIAISPAEIGRALAWQERRLEFVSVPLDEMVAEFNRYNRQKLVIADPGLAAQRFGGTFRPGDPAGFVRLLEAYFEVVAEQRDGETILRSAR
ncbi:MAG: FecR family protein [Opitutaceae bacterium]